MHEQNWRITLLLYFDLLIMALPKFEEAVKKAIDERVVANAVVVASSKGNLSHSWKRQRLLY